MRSVGFRSVGVDPSMGALGELVSYRPTPGLGVDVAASRDPKPVLAPEAATYQSPVQRVLSSGIYRAAQVVSTAGLAFHGYRRNESVGWAIGWALLGGLVPIIAWPVALAQGFGKPKRALTPNRSKKKRRRRQRKNSSVRDERAASGRRFVEIPPETVELLDSGELSARDFDPDFESLTYIIDSYPDYDEEIESLGVGRSFDMSDGWRIKRVK